MAPLPPIDLQLRATTNGFARFRQGELIASDAMDVKQTRIDRSFFSDGFSPKN